LLLGLRALVLAIACLVVLVPLVYLVLNSVKLPREFLTVPPTILPSQITFEHYRNAFGDPNTSRIFMNSLIVASVTTALSIAIGTLAAYALARVRLSTAALSAILFVFLFIRFYPRITTVIPYFLMMRSVKLLDSVWAIVLGHLGITIPFVTWLMLVIFRDLPIEMEEAAMVDGGNPWQRLWHVVLPVTAPGVASAAIFTAFLSWNEFLIASSVARRGATVLSMTVASFVTDKGIYWGPMSAMSVVMIAPMIIFALFVQRYLIQGLTLGAVKG
jgi:multiple sugar transport system permease protein